MATPFLSLEICAPEMPLVQLDVTETTITGAAGVFTVHPEHTPLLSTLIPGILTAIDIEGTEHFFAVHGGFAEVKDDKVVILASFYETSDDVDDSRAEEAEERAKNRLRKPPEDMDWVRAEAALNRAVARMSASKKQGYS